MQLRERASACVQEAGARDESQPHDQDEVAKCVGIIFSQRGRVRATYFHKCCRVVPWRIPDMGDSPGVEALLQRLETQRNAFATTFTQLHDVLMKDLEASVRRETTTPPIPRATSISIDTPTARSPRPSMVSYDTTDRPRDIRKSSAGVITLETTSDSRATGQESSEDEDDESYYVQSPLDHEFYDHEGLREHLKSYPWTRYGKEVLQDAIDKSRRLTRPPLFPTIRGLVSDRSHISHLEVFDIGTDGAPLLVELPEPEQGPSNAFKIWNSIKEINNPGKERKAVGRITNLHEPSPSLFGAIHFTSKASFDVDEIFQHLVSISRSSANVHRAYDQDHRRRRSFVFNFEYFTIIGEDCEPMAWQMTDRQNGRKPHHTPITRCSSVVALSLAGEPIKKIKNRSRRRTTEHGYVYDPFAPWQLLNVHCYPDCVSSGDSHEPSRNYVNGVEAFMVALLGEFRDAAKRFEQIYEAITELITPPLNFMFDSSVRDNLLFEDSDFTLCRRYFWAYQTLGIVNDSLKAIVDAYEDTFTDEVWEGKHKTLWPLPDQDSPRNLYFKKRMAALRKKLGFEITRLRAQMAENDQKRDDIKGLREELFVGTSIQESRKSVENTEVAIQQGHNIKLLTLVNIFFLPLTFVTSVFGMSNMPQKHDYWMFAIVISTVCVPFFILIGSLNTTRGMRFWREQFLMIFHFAGLMVAWIGSCGRRKNVVESIDSDMEAETQQITHLMAQRRKSGLHRLFSREASFSDHVAMSDVDTVRSPLPKPPFRSSRKSSHIADLWTKEARQSRLG